MDTSLTFVGDLGVIKVITPEKPMGRIIYPPIFPPSVMEADFTSPAAGLNGFHTAIHNEADEPPSCTLSGSDIWFVCADTQCLVDRREINLL